jgi:DNA polymerase-3 subunit epsilon
MPLPLFRLSKQPFLRLSYLRNFYYGAWETRTLDHLLETLNLKTLRGLVETLGITCKDKRKLVCLREAILSSGSVSSPDVRELILKENQKTSKRSEIDVSKKRAAAVQPEFARSFVAIDFETANRSRNSACAISVVCVQDNVIVKTYTQLIRPPILHFEFTYIHGITARDVRDAPTYREIHQEVLNHISGAEFIAAHNASFDASVLNALCQYWNLQAPSTPWKCTVKIARNSWGIYPTKLPNVCDHLGIALKHHDATSDATACAKIVLAHQSKFQISS